MPINTVQFQKGLSLPEFPDQYGTKEQCEAALVAMRWPKGWVCPNCACTRYASTHNGRKLWECLGVNTNAHRLQGRCLSTPNYPYRFGSWAFIW
jgi:hypothetical protein